MAIIRTTLFCLSVLAFILPGRSQEMTRFPPDANDSSSPANEPQSPRLELTIEHWRTLNGDYDSYTGGELRGTLFVDKYDCVGVFVDGGVLELQSGSYADSIASRPDVFRFGVAGEHHFTPKHTVFQPYVSAEFSCFWMVWNYRNPMPVDSRTINGDSMSNLEGSVGAGFEMRLQHLSVFGEARVGGVWMNGQTDGGVDNTFFDSVGYIGLRAGLIINF